MFVQGMGILKPIHVCIFKPQIQIQIPFVKPSNLNQPNPQIHKQLQRKELSAQRKKEKIEQKKKRVSKRGWSLKLEKFFSSFFFNGSETSLPGHGVQRRPKIFCDER